MSISTLRIPRINELSDPESTPSHSVVEIGRYYGEVDGGHFQTWTHGSGQDIPEECKIPEINKIPRNLLPLDLSPERDTNFHNSSTYSVEYILRWAKEENYSLEDVDFVMSRSSIRIISLTHYRDRFKWMYWIYRYGDKIYFASPHNEIQPGALRRDTTNKEMWGKRFADLMKTGGEGTPLYGGEDVDPRVVRTIRLGENLIVTTAKISCQLSNPNGCGLHDAIDKYVELKTMPIKLTLYDMRFAWTHCKLIGIETVYFGLRTDEGELHYIDKYTMDELERMELKYHDTSVFKTFLDDVLSWIKSKTENGKSYTIRRDTFNITLLNEDHDDFVRKIHEYV